MADLATIATIAVAASTVIGAGAAVYQGYATYQASQQQAHEVEKQGTASFAAAQRDALERRLQGKLLLSQQQAAAAASGGGAGTDAPTIVRLMTQTAQRTEYGAASALFQGYADKNNAELSAANIRKSGFASFIGGILSGVGTLAGGMGDTFNMADKYNLMPKGRSASTAWGWSSLPAT